MVRGIKEATDRFINDCLAQYLPFKYDPDKEKGALQLSMRPIQLYEIVFPADQLNEVCAIVQPYSLNGAEAKEQKIAKWLGKALGIVGLKPIPQGIKPNLRVRNKAVSVIGIGLKEDAWNGEIEQL